MLNGTASRQHIPEPGRYTSRREDYLYQWPWHLRHPVSQHSLQREMTSLALWGATWPDAGQSRGSGPPHAPG